jgi:ubiquinone/menaquinone biosynthesis C-methylase UbiE
MKRVVLDLGCGSSFQITDILKDSLDAWIIGVDWDFSFCRKSKEGAREHGVDAEYVCCDAGLLPFQDEIFDVIYALDSLRCLKGHQPQQFFKEAYRKLRHGAEMHIAGLDKVSFRGKDLPVFKDLSLPFNWSSYIPQNGSSPFISEEPSEKELNVHRRYKYVGILKEKMVSELLWQCYMEPESNWESKKEGAFTYHFYTITTRKAGSD